MPAIVLAIFGFELIGVALVLLGFVLIGYNIVLSEREPQAATDSTREEDAIDVLRREYAAGKIDEEEFERRVERLIETEDAEVHSESVDRVEEYET